MPIPILRRLDLDRSGRIETADLLHAHEEYFRRRISRDELLEARDAWLRGQVFPPRVLPVRPADFAPTPRAIVERRPHGVLAHDPAPPRAVKTP